MADPHTCYSKIYCKILKFLGTLLFTNKPTSSIIYKLQWKVSNVSVMDVLASLCTSITSILGVMLDKNCANNDYFSESSLGPTRNPSRIPFGPRTPVWKPLSHTDSFFCLMMKWGDWNCRTGHWRTNENARVCAVICCSSHCFTCRCRGHMSRTSPHHGTHCVLALFVRLTYTLVVDGVKTVNHQASSLPLSYSLRLYTAVLHCMRFPGKCASERIWKSTTVWLCCWKM